MNRCNLGLVVFGIGLIFTAVQTTHFGNHLLPHTLAEAACDAIGAMVCLLGAAIATSKP
jgi:hypothetical protein